MCHACARYCALSRGEDYSSRSSSRDVCTARVVVVFEAAGRSSSIRSQQRRTRAILDTLLRCYISPLLPVPLKLLLCANRGRRRRYCVGLEYSLLMCAASLSRESQYWDCYFRATTAVVVVIISNIVRMSTILC